MGWTPMTTLEELLAEMVAADLEEAKKETYLKRKGFAVVGAREIYWRAVVEAMRRPAWLFDSRAKADGAAARAAGLNAWTVGEG